MATATSTKPCILWTTSDRKADPKTQYAVLRTASETDAAPAVRGSWMANTFAGEEAKNQNNAIQAAL